MTAARWGLLLAALGALLAVRASAADPPHWTSAGFTIDCTSQCHTLHQASGVGLTPAAENVTLCQSCHNPSGLASDLPLSTADKAVRHERGTSHAFEVAAVNAELSTTLPTDLQMQLRVMSDNIVCSTCHNQHNAESTFGGEGRVGNAVQRTSLGSTGTLSSGGTYTGSAGLWYLIRIVDAGDNSAGGSGAKFCYSKDNGTSWFPTGCNPPGTLTPNLSANGGAGVALDGLGPIVTFGAGNYAEGEQWEFSAAYPFLRATFGTGGATFCANCHDAWTTTVADVEGWNGGAQKSHPIGVSLGNSYDRTQPLDGDGAAQSSGSSPDVDGNATNDLELFGSNVQCLTCHGVHFADSNTETVDRR